MSYPVAYAADFSPDRSRLTTFFRYLLAIPHFFVAMVFALLLIVTVPLAWFAVVFTGNYPGALYSYNAGFLRYVARLNGYVSLVTDRYPPFGLGEDDDYPVRLRVADPQPEYSRAKALFRIVLMIPVYLIAYVLQLVGLVASVVSWFWIVITGRQNDGLHGALVLTQAYNMKAFAYYMLLTETWPPFSEESASAGAPREVAATPVAATSLDAPESVGPAASTLPPPPSRDTPSPATGTPQPSPFAQRDEKDGGMTSGDPLG